MSTCRFLSLVLVLEKELENGESTGRDGDSSSPSSPPVSLVDLLFSFSDSSQSEQPLQRAMYNIDIRTNLCAV